jgi:hypothetical protein
MKISADDLVLILQRAIDRFVRRLRRGGPLLATHRRFLIVQIDGVSRVVLEQGLAWAQRAQIRNVVRATVATLDHVIDDQPATKTS